MDTSKKVRGKDSVPSIEELPYWRLNADKKLEREFHFNSFAEAFSFMTRVAMEAERMDHHPDWFNCGGRVKIELVSHVAGSVTEKDRVLARKIDQISWVKPEEEEPRASA